MIPKYRAWNEETKTLADIKFIDFKKELVKLSHWEYGNSVLIPFEEIVFMQSTGLFDKKGNEIFEGDLISNCDGVWEVKRNKNQPANLDAIEPGNKYTGDIWSLIDLLNGNYYPACIFVGNIYQNPELINK